jgi:hypothetical protein
MSDLSISFEVRIRIIELMEMFSDRESLYILGGDSLINLWFDFVPSAELSEFPSPVFSEFERGILLLVIKAVDQVVDGTPNLMPVPQELEKLKVWKDLALLCHKALQVFSIRGKYPFEYHRA